MEAIPLSEMSAAACAKALTFNWISCFGVPKTKLWAAIYFQSLVATLQDA
jgi:hypothetical protein